MKNKLLLIISLLSINIFSCKNQTKPTIVGKWRVVNDSINLPSGLSEKKYFVFDSTNFYSIRELTESSQYKIKGDTMFSYYKSNNTPKSDTAIFSVVSNDSILIKVQGMQKLLGFPDWYLVREK